MRVDGKRVEFDVNVIDYHFPALPPLLRSGIFRSLFFALRCKFRFLLASIYESL